MTKLYKLMKENKRTETLNKLSNGRRERTTEGKSQLLENDSWMNRHATTSFW